MTHLMEQLVDAYASIRKCTSEGRTSMSLDFKVLVNGLEKLSPIKYNKAFLYIVLILKANSFGWICGYFH